MFFNLSDFLTQYFQKEKIDLWAPVPLNNCTVRKAYLLERAGIPAAGTVFMIAIPYYSHACAAPNRNISAYAVSRDYHGFFSDLFDRMLPDLRQQFPQFRFAGFSDHSPIDEVDAAVRAGLGMLGQNHLLLTERYSSYIFLGELITDAQIPCSPKEFRRCSSCGACQKHCPAEWCGGCLSALTQKKGYLDETEQALIIKFGSAWGCDICQEVCPVTIHAIQTGSIFSPIPYFQEHALPHLTVAELEGMSDETFRSRAYAWRGRETIRRNLLLLEDSGKPYENEETETDGCFRKGTIC